MSPVTLEKSCDNQMICFSPSPMYSPTNSFLQLENTSPVSEISVRTHTHTHTTVPNNCTLLPLQILYVFICYIRSSSSRVSVEGAYNRASCAYNNVDRDVRGCCILGTFNCLVTCGVHDVSSTRTYVYRTWKTTMTPPAHPALLLNLWRRVESVVARC